MYCHHLLCIVIIIKINCILIVIFLLFVFLYIYIFDILELEDLIKKILVKNPSQRYTLNQIKGHPWMLEAPLEKRTFNPNIQNLECGLNGFNGELNSQVLQLMQTLNIDISKTETVRFSIFKYILTGGGH